VRPCCWAVAGLTNELAQVSEELEKVKGTMAGRCRFTLSNAR